MGKDLNLLKDLLSEENSQLIQEMKQGYLVGMTNALTLVNTSLILYLFYRFILKKDKEAALKLISGILGATHVELVNGMLKSLEDIEEDSYIKDENDNKLSENIRKILEGSFRDIKAGLQESFEGAISQFSKLDTPGTGTLPTSDSGTGNVPS
jgi:hypothetical protein